MRDVLTHLNQSIKANKITLNSDDKTFHETLYYLQHLCLIKYKIL